jgi:hypothetical protein
MRVAISIDDERRRGLFADRIGRGARVCFPADGGELLRLVRLRAVDVVVASVLNRRDMVFWSDALRQVQVLAPEVGIVGVIEPAPASLHEAVALARDLPGIGFVSHPDARLDHLVRSRSAASPPPTATPLLLDLIDALPLWNIGRDFGLLQALRPCFAIDVPRQAAALGASRRKLELWFQAPDICTPRRVKSICAAVEAAHLRMVCRLPDRDVAAVVGILTEDGVPNPLGVSREIRMVLGVGREALRVSGMAAVAAAAAAKLRNARDPAALPARWAPETRYIAPPEVLFLHEEERPTLVDPGRGLMYSLDGFGADTWELIRRGATFAEMTAELATRRREPMRRVRARLAALLGELLVRGLLQRGRAEASGEA